MADLDVGGIRFNVVQMGPGDDPVDDPYAGYRLPVVFLHGLIMDNLASFFYTIAPAVARTTDVVLYDLRGHGRTERPLDGYRIEDGVDDLVGVLDAVGIDGPVHLVANSFGGTIALAAALRRPDRVGGMVLIEAHPAFEGWGDEMIEDLQDLVEGFDGPGIRDYLAAGAPRSLRTMVRTCEELVTVSSLGDDLRASRPTRPEDLATIDCPSVLLYGESSDILDRAFVLEDSIPGTVLEVVDNCSHALLMENPHEVERLTLQWLDQQAEHAWRHDEAAHGNRLALWSRVLVVVPPLTGHINPTVPLGSELTARGHEVAWAGLPGVVDRLLPAGATFIPIIGALDQAAFDEMQTAAHGLRGPEALKFLWEGFIIPYAMATAPELLEAVTAYAPDLLVVDQQAVAGAVVARQAGIPWATSATTSAELTDPLAALPKVDDWVREQLVDLQLELGVDPEVVLRGDLRFSEHLILAFTTEALFGPMATPDPSIHFVGPSIEARPEPTPFPWTWLDPARPRVLVSLGTVNAAMGGRFFATAVEAFAGTEIQAVIVAPPDQVRVPDGVDNVLVLERVPQLALLEHLDAVVSHGGHNTVCETLAHGLPLVLAPIRDDQPIVADQVVRAGAGRRVRFGRVRPDELLEAVRTVLLEPGYRQAAAVVQASFLDAGGAAAAADALEALLSVKEPA